jgi:uncharacterized protein YjbJ (UPF0337 family)
MENFNKDQIKGSWNEIKGSIKQKWGKLTDNDLKEFEGNFDGLKGKIQKLYGLTKEKASQEFDETIGKLKLKGESLKDRFSDSANSAVNGAKDRVDQADSKIRNS